MAWFMEPSLAGGLAFLLPPLLIGLSPYIPVGAFSLGIWSPPRVRIILARYAVQTAGGPIHQEYWIPAGDLAEFNANVVGPIEVIAEFHPGGTGG
jgi:hypothetical protein